MNGMISGIKRMEVHDGDGLRTTVFFKGCPLRCLWCHNPESLSFEIQFAHFKHKCISCGACTGARDRRAAEACPTGALWQYGKEYSVGELVDFVCRDEPFFKNGGGVTLSGGECLAQPKFAIAVAKAFYERGISVFIDTCGYVKREVLDEIIPYTDKFLYDVKAIDPEVHKQCTGKDNALILDNLKFLCERGCKVEIRYPLIKGYNDGECAEIAKALSKIQGISRIKVLRYHSFSASRYEALNMQNTLPAVETAEADVDAAVSTLRSYGLDAINGMNEN